MARLAKCPQQHVWSPAADDPVAPGALTCPVCGEIGATLAIGAEDSTIGLETLDAKAIPPVAGDVSRSFDANLERARRRAGVGTPTIPGYEIVRELGRGGMGVVYLARHQELKRLVALKMILAGVHADKETLARFHREAEAVARLQHPGITQIHDVGQHDGRPYLALEYIDGSNLADQLAGKALSPRAAAGLVETIARTAHYAHQRGIVHRDLTPRNILLASSTSTHGVRLVKNDPKAYEPKITDFGLAKELDAEVMHTQTGMVMGTPSYMSPEQAQGKTHEITPATDVYAIGAILYQSLTGRPPFLAATSYDTLKQVIEREPVPPARLQPGVPRDLETICLKCLSKDPAKRYASAEALADDLHRFLATEPILARRVPWYERTWKWAKRRPAVAALLAVIVLAASTFTVGSIVYNSRLRAERDRAEAHFQRAERNFLMARQAVDEMLTEVGDAKLEDEPGMEETRKKLLSDALKLYESFLAQKSDDPNVRMDTARAYQRVGDIQRLLAEYGPSQRAYDQALDMTGQLANESPQNADYRQQLAYCLNWRGEISRLLGRYRDADADFVAAQKTLETLPEPRPADREELARTLYNRGILLRDTQRPAEAEDHFRRAIKLLGGLAGQSSDEPKREPHLARAYLNLGTVIPSRERFADAQDAYEQAVAILESVTTKFPNKREYRYELGVTYNNLGNLYLRNNQPDSAKQSYAKALNLFQKLADDFPKAPIYRQELANSFNSMGSVEKRQGDVAAASESWRHAVKLLGKLSDEDMSMAAYQSDLAMVLANLGLADFAQSQLPRAREDFEKSIELLKRLSQSNPNNIDHKQLLRDDYQNLAEVLLSAHDHEAAANAARALSRIFPDDGQGYYLAACYLARSATEVASDESIEPPQRQRTEQQYADEAVATLRSALEHGFHDADRIQLDRDQALHAIAGRDDFQELLARIHTDKPAQ